MAFLDHNGEIEVPYSKNDVFKSVEEAINKINGMKVDKADKITGHILVKAGVSLFSWGENISINLTELQNGYTGICITSSPKTGALFGGAKDMGKNRKNIEIIIDAISKSLKKMKPIEETKSNEGSSSDVDSKLRKLKGLLDNGLIEADDYEQKKKEILNSL